MRFLTYIVILTFALTNAILAAGELSNEDKKLTEIYINSLSLEYFFVECSLINSMHNYEILYDEWLKKHQLSINKGLNILKRHHGADYTLMKSFLDDKSRAEISRYKSSTKDEKTKVCTRVAEFATS